MEKKINPDDLLTIKQACDHARVSRRTVYNWITSGKVQCIRTVGGSIRIVAGSLFKPFKPSDT